jgi:hypothetical protein
MRFFVVVGFMLSIAGCSLLGISTGDLTLTTDQQVYATNDTVGLTIENDTNLRYEMGTFCFARLERQNGAAWQTVEPSEERVCTLPLFGLPPGEQLEGGFLLYDDLKAGTYRLVQRVYRDISEDEGVPVASNPFEVR